ncbi:MAG: hypothetical protein PF569_07590 [Candidatus Woesearchaeota archaeon]|jgi:hypothetical protein|nr:hypothetical protein [Candidatus Woesearchaeota archaeon]
MKNNHESKYAPDGRPIKDSMFKINKDSNHGLTIKIIFGTLITLAVIYFMISPKLAMILGQGLFYLVLIIFLGYMKIRQIDDTFNDNKGSNPLDIESDDEIDEILDQYDDESDFDQKKADKLIEEFNK